MIATYRSINYVDVHDEAASTSFQFDHWLPSGPIISTHPALFSDTLRPNILVQIAFQDGFESHLRPRLTRAAASELDSLLFALSCRTFVSRMVLKLDG
jgi:hypothetical protein